MSNATTIYLGVWSMIVLLVGVVFIYKDVTAIGYLLVALSIMMSFILTVVNEVLRQLRKIVAENSHGS